jgi:tRNA (guanine37-N1)-methyltransferase
MNFSPAFSGPAFFIGACLTTPMKFSILTIFPDMFTGFLEHGIIRRALDRGLIDTDVINIREHAKGRHLVTDDRPFGGGDGMVMKPEPLAGAIRQAVHRHPGALTIHLTPQGRAFDQDTARELSEIGNIVLICGRYDGIDERICENLIDRELSIGDYVLTGGELAAMVVVDAVTRLLPGALGGKTSAATDSFAAKFLAHAQYTRPQIFEDQPVPDVLLSGNHRKIDDWRLESGLIRTLLKRPDLLSGHVFTKEEKNILKEWQARLNRLIGSNQEDGLC